MDEDVFEDEEAEYEYIYYNDTDSMDSNLTFPSYNPGTYQRVDLINRGGKTSFEQYLLYITLYAGYVYMILAVIGILLNTYVVTKLTRFAIADYERFKNGCGFPLAAMSISDLLSLLSITFVVFLNTIDSEVKLPYGVYALQCKITMYIIHTMTTFSIWCWLFVSALRYMAVYHPFWRASRWKLGSRLLCSILLFVLISNGWLLISVFPIMGIQQCGESQLVDVIDLNLILHSGELFWAYILPALITLTLDIRVILTTPPNFARSVEKHRRSRESNSVTSTRKKLSRCEWMKKVLRINIERRVSESSRRTSEMSMQFEFRKSLQSGSMFLISMFTGSVSSNDPAIVLKPLDISRARTTPNSPTPKFDDPPTLYDAQSVQKTPTIRVKDGDKEFYLNCSTSILQSGRPPVSRGRSAVWCWLAITTISLILNAPDNIMKIITIINRGETKDSSTIHLIALISRLMYFAQFCFNAAFLSKIVYRRSVQPRKNIRIRMYEKESSLTNQHYITVKHLEPAIERRCHSALGRLETRDKTHKFSIFIPPPNCGEQSPLMNQRRPLTPTTSAPPQDSRFLRPTLSVNYNYGSSIASSESSSKSSLEDSDSRN